MYILIHITYYITHKHFIYANIQFKQSDPRTKSRFSECNHYELCF